MFYESGGRGVNFSLSLGVWESEEPKRSWGGGLGCD